MRPAALLSLVLLIPLTGCESGSNPPATALTLRAVNSFVGRSVFHLECSPAGGDLPSPSRACAALSATPQLITKPKPFTCAGGMSSWWDVSISGRFDGKPIHRVFSTCWTPQMATIGRLGLSWTALQKHLLPRRHEAVLAGAARSFAPGVLEPADLVTCDIRGHHLSEGVPNDTGPGASTGYGGANIVSVTLSVTRHRDGSVEARCHDGGS